MDLSKNKAVIADDDVFKGIDIRKALEFNGVRINFKEVLGKLKKDS